MTATLRGSIVDVDGPKTVQTKHGDRQLAAFTLRVDDRHLGSTPATDEPIVEDGIARVTTWGKWAETATYAESGMELLVTDPTEGTYRGSTTYSTSSASYVILEPGFLVDVTDVRNWVQCPREYYLNKLSSVPLKYPVVKGTIVHEVFGDLLRGRALERSIDDRVDEAGLELGLLGRDVEEVKDEVRRNAAAIDGWLSQGTLTGEDAWRSEYTLISPTFGLKGRADALRRGMPVELKTGKNTTREPRFPDKIQAASYGLLLEERGVPVNTGTLLYTKNTALDRGEQSGDLSPAKEFSIGRGLFEYVVRCRNHLAAMEVAGDVPTGYEADAKCEYCFSQDTCLVVSGRLEQDSKAGAIGSPLPAAERAYFERFYEAIEAERRTVHAEYRKLWEQTAAERADDDRALIDLEYVGREAIDGNRWRLTARNATGAVSKLREGDLALASDGDPVTGHAELCRIERLEESVVVTTDEPVELRRLDVYPTELSVDRMLTALHDAILTGDPDTKDVLFERRQPAFREESTTYVENNAAQNEAVTIGVNAEDFAVIHGPPGTGKTYTIATLVCELVDRGDRVLLTAFTNRAVDNALEALREQGFEDAVRVGTKSGIRSDMLDLRLPRRGDPDERAAALRGAPVVAATTTSCGSRVLSEEQFDVAVVDEASQLTEPATLAAITLADRFVLVGDHEQLPPVVRSDTDLQRSLFERLIDAYPEAGVMLDRQYRMAQRIQAFASTEFYDGALRPATAEVAAQSLSDLGVELQELPEDLRERVSFVDPGGSRRGNANPIEADRVAEIVDAYVAAGVDPDDIGVIAPFRAQVAEIGRRTDVTVDTVDRFQGSSTEVVVVSFVATGSLDGPIFEDYRRVNVALTRAKKALVLVGDAAALASDPFYDRMLDWASR
ncbi:MAG: AAA domain-containing protein [Halobacteriota archaeon]